MPLISRLNIRPRGGFRFRGGTAGSNTLAPYGPTGTSPGTQGPIDLGGNLFYDPETGQIIRGGMVAGPNGTVPSWSPQDFGPEFAQNISGLQNAAEAGYGKEYLQQRPIDLPDASSATQDLSRFQGVDRAQMERNVPASQAGSVQRTPRRGSMSQMNVTQASPTTQSGGGAMPQPTTPQISMNSTPAPRSMSFSPGAVEAPSLQGSGLSGSMTGKDRKRRKLRSKAAGMSGRVRGRRAYS